MFEFLRNLRRRPLRSSLTVGGIAIGIVALVVVGSLAERLQTIVARSSMLNEGVVFAFASGSERDAGEAARRIERGLRPIRTFPGVRAIVPEVILPYRFGSDAGGRFGPPSFIFGFPQAARPFAERTMSLAAGRDLRASDSRTALVGADFAAAERARIGTIISLYGNSYTVIGELAKSFTIFDAAVIVPFEDARTLVPQAISPGSAGLPSAGVSALMIAVTPGTDTRLLAERINLIAGLHARDPQRTAGELRSTMRVFDAIVFGSALISLLVGAISIVNTMAMAVAERTREIGIRKAIGAADLDILREFLLEAGTIGALGGVLGIGAGFVIVAVIDAHNAASGDLELFAITPRLALGSLAFAVVLSALAGIVPAVRAARLAPTEALRRPA